MTSSPSCRVTALGLMPLALLGALAGCGGVGSDVGNDIGQAVGDGVVCGVRNCTESSTLNLDEISPRFTASQAAGDSAVQVRGNLGKSANLLTTVLMAPNERLSASIDGSPEVTMDNPDGKRYDYTAQLPAASALPVVQVVFTRAGVRHVSQVTMPPAFTVLQPTGTPLMTRGGLALPVRLSLATVGTASATAVGSCTRADGSRFTTTGTALGVRADGVVGGGYRLEPATVDDALNAASRSQNNDDPRTSAVARCDLTIVWTSTALGSTPATMNRHGVLRGERSASHLLSYDARP